ncbi:DUF3857 domain-containing transglutaminase family protein [Corallincola platygyrae]|uniref:DUF3857 domain-containing transglutaminase family protein n=1 Tax=Corallincola platygyrae TaxID=1193278 RepID=A0ABW4XS19_9GAMM
MYLKWMAGLALGQLLLLVSLQPALADTHWRIDKAPDWVEPVSADLTSAPSTEAVDYLMTDSQVNLTLKEPVEYRHFSYRINDSLGVEENSDIEIAFNPDFETVVLHHARILRDGKEIDRLSTDDIRVTDLEPEAANRIYSGYKQIGLWLKGVSAGDVIDYSYSLVGENPVFDGHASYFFDLGWGIEVGKVSVKVIASKQRPLNYRLINSDVKVSEQVQGSKIIYSVMLRNTTAVLEEGDNPNWEIIYPYLQMTDFNSWKEVTDWSVALFKRGKGKVSGELVEYIEQLKKLPKKQAIEKAIGFSQEKVRYLGIEIAENSHLPHSPAEVFENRYGDCKDKSLLLVTMLDALGVDASPVLVSTHQTKTVGDYLPTYGLFNHAIASFVYQDKRYWVDPTLTHQGTTLESFYQPDYGAALLVKKGNDQLTMMPSHSAEQHTVSVIQQYHASDYISPVRWQIQAEYTGREAERMRYRLAKTGQKRLSQEYLNYYAQLNEGIESLGAIEIEDDRLINKIVVKEEYLLPKFWKLDQSSSNSNFHFYSDLTDSYLKLPQQVNRSQHLNLYGPVTITQRSELWLPKHVYFITEDEQEVVENDYIRYTIDLTSENRKLILSHQYVTKQETVPPSASAEHIAILREARKYLEYSSSVNNVTSDPSMDAVKALLGHIHQQQTRLAK